MQGEALSPYNLVHFVMKHSCKKQFLLFKRTGLAATKVIQWKSTFYTEEGATEKASLLKILLKSFAKKLSFKPIKMYF
jgi:hypothetical protein